MSNQFPNPPEGIRIKHGYNYLKIIIRWINFNVILFTILVAIYNLFFASLIFLVMINGEFESSSALVIFLLVGILLFYILIIQWINSTCITVNYQTMIINQEPITIKDEINSKIIDIERLYSKEKIKRTPAQKIEYKIYELYAKTSNDYQKIVETNKKETILFIEKILEDYLNLRDEPEKGEIGSIS